MIFFSVFVAGMCIMGVEMAAFRLLAPHFGQTQLLITNVIGTIMIALSIGYWVGGRLSDRYPRPEGISWIMLGAAVFTGAIPLLSRPILAWAARALASQDLGSFAASLAGTVFLFLIPLGALGMVSPFAIRTAMVDRETVGRTSGAIYCLATVGSIVGTYLPTLLLIPWIGTRATILLFAALMLVTAVAGLLRVRRGAAASASALFLIAALGYSGLTPPAKMENVIAEEESLYNYIRVVERDGRNLLFLNEGHGYHSVYDPESVLVNGVWDTFLALPSMVDVGDGRLDVLIIGLAGGTASNQLSHFWRGDLSIDGVEIDPAIIEIADAHFALDRRHLTVHVADGRTFLAGTQKQYDVIIVDAYKQPYIPFYLATQEFFTSCAAHLSPGGLLAINVATFTPRPEFLIMIEDTICSVFPSVYSYRIDNVDVAFSNIVIVASAKALPTTGLARAFPGAPAEVLTRVEKNIRPIEARSEPMVMTDDWAPIEWYVDKTLFAFFRDDNG